MLANRMYATKQKLSGPDCLVPFTHGLVMVIHKFFLQFQKKTNLEGIQSGTINTATDHHLKMEQVL